MENNRNSIHIHSVKYNFIMNIILKISQYVFLLITLPYITRILGAIGNGKVAFASSVISYFSMFAQLGLPVYGIRICASCRDDKDKLTKTVHELLFINGIAVICVYVALGIGLITIPRLRQDFSLMVINSVSILLNMLGMEWLYQAIEQYQYITIRNITFKIVSIILMFIIIHNPEDYVIYCICGSNLLNLCNSKKFLGKKIYKGNYNFKQHLRPIWTFFALSVAVSVYTGMDTVMLGFLSNDEDVAYYVLATKIKIVLANSISALGPVLLPRITYCLNNGQEDKFKEYVKKSLHFVVMVAIPIVIYFMVMSQDMIQILGGKEYGSAVQCMQIITLALIPLGIGNVACQQVLAPLGKEKLTMHSTICGACINFAANFVLIPLLGATGAAVATVLAELVVAVIQVRYAWNELRDAFFDIPYLKFMMINCVSMMVLFVARNIIPVQNSFLMVLLTAGIFFGCYSIGLILVRDDLCLQYGMQILRCIEKKFK